MDPAASQSTQLQQLGPRRSAKSYVTAVCLSAVFGILGVQHFYLRRWGEGVLDVGLTLSAVYAFTVHEPLVGLAFLGLDVLHTIVVTYLLFTGKFRDGSGHLVTYPGQRLPGETPRTDPKLPPTHGDPQ